MFKYIKVFDNHSEYEEFIGTEDFLKPNVSICSKENEVHYAKKTNDYSKDYLTFTALESGTFQFTNPINYSIDNGNTWVELAANTATPTVNDGEKIMWKATLTPNDNGIGTFSSTGNFDIEGNPMSLLFGDRFKGQTSLSGKNYAFSRLFKQSKLVNASNLSLPATTLAEDCYSYMFQNCTSLTTAPELPATTLTRKCYTHMFEGCTSLTTAPELPATILESNCYYSMFRSCTSLTTAPELPATTLASSCYVYMFYGCTSLTTAPELPATTLASSCYQNMFQNCTSLTTAPELPATTLANYCYASMFQGCTSLTTAPQLPATTLAERCCAFMFEGCTSLTTVSELSATTLANACYISMFSGCTRLNRITCLATDISASICTSNWLSNVATSGTFTKAASMTSWTTGVNGIPSNWTVVDA